MTTSIVCYGECLFDCFENEKVIGGAPLNVAARLSSLGNEVRFISRVGKDEDGKAILTFLRENNLSTDFVQIDETLPTGLVQVTLDGKGSPSYNIVAPSAWDAIAANDVLINEVQQSNALLYSTLSLRHQKSRDTLFTLLQASNFNVFDVNLRPPFYDKSLIEVCMAHAHLLKMNDAELEEIVGFYRVPYKDMEANMKFISGQFNVEQICVTAGKHGACFFSQEKIYRCRGIEAPVVDSVGAGDSFLAGLVSELLKGKNIDDALLFGCAIGSMVVAHRGANPPIDLEDIQGLIQAYRFSQ